MTARAAPRSLRASHRRAALRMLMSLLPASAPVHSTANAVAAIARYPPQSVSAGAPSPAQQWFHSPPAVALLRAASLARARSVVILAPAALRAARRPQPARGSGPPSRPQPWKSSADALCAAGAAAALALPLDAAEVSAPLPRRCCPCCCGGGVAAAGSRGGRAVSSANANANGASSKRASGVAGSAGCARKRQQSHLLNGALDAAALPTVCACAVSCSAAQQHQQNGHHVSRPGSSLAVGAARSRRGSLTHSTAGSDATSTAPPAGGLRGLARVQAAADGSYAYQSSDDDDDDDDPDAAAAAAAAALPMFPPLPPTAAWRVDGAGAPALRAALMSAGAADGQWGAPWSARWERRARAATAAALVRLGATVEDPAAGDVHELANGGALGGPDGAAPKLCACCCCANGGVVAAASAADGLDYRAAAESVRGDAIAAAQAAAAGDETAGLLMLPRAAGGARASLPPGQKPSGTAAVPLSARSEARQVSSIAADLAAAVAPPADSAAAAAEAAEAAAKAVADKAAADKAAAALARAVATERATIAAARAWLDSTPAAVAAALSASSSSAAVASAPTRTPRAGGDAAESSSSMASAAVRSGVRGRAAWLRAADAALAVAFTNSHAPAGMTAGPGVGAGGAGAGTRGALTRLRRAVLELLAPAPDVAAAVDPRQIARGGK